MPAMKGSERKEKGKNFRLKVFEGKSCKRVFELEAQVKFQKENLKVPFER